MVIYPGAGREYYVGAQTSSDGSHINKDKAGYENDISVESKSISTLSVHPVKTESSSKIIEGLTISFHGTTLIRSALFTYIQSDKSLRNPGASAYIWGFLTCH